MAYGYTKKNEQKKEMNFPAAGAEPAQLWKKAFKSSITVGSALVLSHTDAQCDF